jgi:hypothetical protein
MNLHYVLVFVYFFTSLNYKKFRNKNQVQDHIQPQHLTNLSKFIIFNQKHKNNGDGYGKEDFLP